jgi:uncharacterized protein YoxC
VTLGRFTALDGLWILLTIFLILASAALVYAVARLGSTVGRLGASLQGARDDALPLVRKVEGAVDHVDARLAKVDQVADGAVAAAQALDSAVRAATSAVAGPARTFSAFTAGIAHGSAVLRAGRDVREAFAAGRQAASRRGRDLEEKLTR